MPRANYAQMPLFDALPAEVSKSTGFGSGQTSKPFDLAELRKPAHITPVAIAPPLPPGLREFALAERLPFDVWPPLRVANDESPAAKASKPDERVHKLAQAWDTIRGGRPVSLGEWRLFYMAVEPYFKDGE